MQDHLPINGLFIATLHDPKTGALRAYRRTPNIITRVGKNLVARMLLDRAGFDVGLTYAAIGTGTTAVNVADTTLNTERVRRAITSRNDTSTNVAAFFTLFPGAVAAFPNAGVTSPITEVAIFGGSEASDITDSGILFARALLNIDNTEGNDLNLSYVLTIG